MTLFFAMLESGALTGSAGRARVPWLLASPVRLSRWSGVVPTDWGPMGDHFLLKQLYSE